jgi:DNA gyrase subunit B
VWQNTTHDWATTVDQAHLAAIRDDPARYAPGGAHHLALEVIAYPLEEALETGGGRCTVTLHADGSVSVRDDGRGTDTRHGPDGVPVRKPVMATQDLRFFDASDGPLLPDGHPRSGMSVVAALSVWLVHTNHRHDGAWTQRYEHGVPVTDLIPVDGTGSTGTTVHFLPDADLLADARPDAAALARIVWPRELLLTTHDEAGHSHITGSTPRCG